MTDKWFIAVTTLDLQLVVDMCFWGLTSSPDAFIFCSSFFLTFSSAFLRIDILGSHPRPAIH